MAPRLGDRLCKTEATRPSDPARTLHQLHAYQAEEPEGAAGPCVPCTSHAQSKAKELEGSHPCVHGAPPPPRPSEEPCPRGAPLSGRRGRGSPPARRRQATKSLCSLVELRPKAAPDAPAPPGGPHPQLTVTLIPLLGPPDRESPGGKSRRRRAYPQQIVTTRLLYCLQDPFAQLSRLQRI